MKKKIQTVLMSSKPQWNTVFNRTMAAISLALSPCVMQAKADTIFAKLVNGNFAYYTNSACTVEYQLETPPETGIDGCKVLFDSDEEYQALVPYTNELATAMGGVPYLQNDVAFSNDTDWSAFDFNLNGKTLSIVNEAVLTIGNIKGNGTIQAPSVIKDGNFNIGSGSVIWASDITSKSEWKASGSVFVTNDGGNTYIYSHKNKPTSGNYWLGFWEAPGTNPNKTDNPPPSIQQNFSIPAAGQYYINFRYARYSSYNVKNGENTSNGSTVANARNRKVVANFSKDGQVVNTITSPAASSTEGGVMLGETSVGTLEAGEGYTLQLTRNAPGKNPLGPIIDEVMVYAKGTLNWKIPENETCDNTEITLKGEFLLVRKTGLGTLAMTKTNDAFGRPEQTSMIVEEGKVIKAESTSATCGVQYSRIVVEDGGQFDINGCKYWDYDYTLAGSGPDGTGALTSTAELEAKTAYTKSASTGFVRNITLSDDATIFAGNNMAMMFNNNQANSMKMNGHTVTYDGQSRNYRLFLGNMSYSGTGKIVVATNGKVQGHNSVVTAGGCDVEIYGSYWQNTGRLSPVKSFVFKGGSSFRELNTNATAIVVYTKYAPPPNSESVAGYNKRPLVQLGDAEHLNTTFDLSHWTTTFDDSAEGTLTFHEGTIAAPMIVTVEVGDRTVGLGGYAYRWNTKPNFANVKFVRSESMIDRGIYLMVDDHGLRFKTGISIHIR